MTRRIFLASALLVGLSSAASAQVELDTSNLELDAPSVDYRRRTIGSGLLGLGLALVVSSAPVTLIEAIVGDDRSNALFATHAALTAVGTAMAIGGIVRLARTSRLDDRRRLRRRVIPLVILVALSHAAASFVSVLATVDVGGGFAP